MKKKTRAEELTAPEHPHLSPSAEFGLTQAQVEAQKDAGLINTAVQSSARSVSTIVKENLFTYFNLVFLILAALVVAAGSLRSLTFLPVVIVNTLIGIVQELRAKKELDKLTLLNAPRAMVVREGKVQEVPAEELVQDDVVEFHAGDQICADAVLLIVGGNILQHGHDIDLRRTVCRFDMQNAVKSVCGIALCRPDIFLIIHSVFPPMRSALRRALRKSAPAGGHIFLHSLLPPELLQPHDSSPLRHS